MGIIYYQIETWYLYVGEYCKQLSEENKSHVYFKTETKGDDKRE